MIEPWQPNIQVITSAASASGSFSNGVNTINVGTLVLNRGLYNVFSGLNFSPSPNSFNYHTLSISNTSATLDLGRSTQPQAAATGSFASYGSVATYFSIYTDNTTLYSVCSTWVPTGTAAYAGLSFFAVKIGNV